LKKDLAIIGGLFLVIAALLVFGRGFTTVGQLPGARESTQSAGTNPREQVEEGKTRIRAKTLDVTAEIAASDKEKKKGLSDRESLPISEGMFFVYDKMANYTFWMKDVQFPIDIIWIDKDKKIVYIAHNAQPERDKNDDELKRYKPSAEAQYILEINAGLAAANGLEIGDQVDFVLQTP